MTPLRSRVRWCENRVASIFFGINLNIPFEYHPEDQWRDHPRSGHPPAHSINTIAGLYTLQAQQTRNPFLIVCGCHRRVCYTKLRQWYQACFLHSQKFLGRAQLPSYLISNHCLATLLPPNVGQSVAHLDLAPSSQNMVILDGAAVTWSISTCDLKAHIPICHGARQFRAAT